MKILLRNLLAFLLVFVMIFTLGVTSFTEDVDNYGEPLDVLSNSYSSDDSVQGDVYGGFDEDDIGTIPIPQEPDEVEKDVYEPPKEFTEDDGEDDGDNDRDNDGA
jgi:TATA-binding protein-associated factor Taf7